MLKINNLNAEIDKKSILNDFKLEINPGEVHAIMGPNGSGKSTSKRVNFYFVIVDHITNICVYYIRITLLDI